MGAVEIPDGPFSSARVSASEHFLAGILLLTVQLCSAVSRRVVDCHQTTAGSDLAAIHLSEEIQGFGGARVVSVAIGENTLPGNVEQMASSPALFFNYDTYASASAAVIGTWMDTFCEEIWYVCRLAGDSHCALPGGAVVYGRGFVQETAEAIKCFLDGETLVCSSNPLGPSTLIHPSTRAPLCSRAIPRDPKPGSHPDPLPLPFRRG